MTALDPQSTTGAVAAEPGPPCLCGDPETVHDISTRGGTRFRARCTRSGCGCTTYRPAPAVPGMVAVGPDVRPFLLAPPACRVVALIGGRRWPAAGVRYDADANEIVVDLAHAGAGDG